MDHLMEESDIERILIPLVVPPKTSQIPPNNLPTTKDAFHKFPQEWGWRLDNEFKLDILAGESTGKIARFGVLLQAWLYFGLILTVVQMGDEPILQYDDLYSGNHLSTKNLKAAVEKWVDWEIRNPEGRWIRLIQVGYVLEKARHVVRTNCSSTLEIEPGMERDAGEDDSSTAEAGREELSAMPRGYTTATREPRHLTDDCALALMLVGEYLWAAKSRILQQCGENLVGWHADDDAGWGPPRYILDRMISRRWCPHAVFLLKGQLRSSATLLLHAWSTYEKCEDRMVTWHKDCDRKICRARTMDREGNYTNLCLPKDLSRHEPDQDDCEMVGPDMDEILKVLGSTDHSSRGGSDIPLIRFDSPDDGPISFAVESLRRQNPQPFATISHVWSDGWGNEKVNKLRTCQLRFIRRQLRRANGGKDIPFWMDTLVVPVREFAEGEEMDWDWREKKTKAIAQIFELFEKSTYTVILDNGLCSMPPGLQEKPADAAMKILASGWMRRLWTLHEAFLSKKRYVTFLETADEHDNLTNLETLLEQLNTPAAQKSPLVSWVRDLLLQNIMDREAKIHADPEKRFAQRQAAMLVAGTWRAATWRTTSNAAHESLALATLLNVTYKGTEIEEAGLTMDNTQEKLTRLVREFWREFHLTYKNCIPAGIIFLPGEKVNLLGYGWAPMTWMSAHEADYPDPLSRWTAETDLLEQKGLLVQYPGFLLHTESRESRKQILGVDQTLTVPKFTFPVDNSLLEWYSVRPADSEAKIEYLEGILESTHPLAIILSRPQPKAAPPEIGLLVEVYSIDDEKIRREGDDGSRQRYSCQVIRRVHVWRETAKSYLAGPGRNGPVRARDIDESTDAVGAADRSDTPHWRIIGGIFTEIKDDCCVGETLSSTQKWIVDGYFSPDRGKRKPNPNMPPSALPREGAKGKEINASGPTSSQEASPENPQETPFYHKISLPWSFVGRRTSADNPAIQPSAVSTSKPPGPGNLRRERTRPPDAEFAPREGLAQAERSMRRSETFRDAGAQPKPRLRRTHTLFNPK